MMTARVDPLSDGTDSQVVFDVTDATASAALSTDCWPFAASYALIMKAGLVGKSQCLPTDVVCASGTAGGMSGMHSMESGMMGGMDGGAADDGNLAVCAGKSDALKLATWLFDGPEVTQAMRLLGRVAPVDNPC